MPTTTIRRPRTYTPDDVFDMEDEGKAFELNELGELQPRASGAYASLVAAHVGSELLRFADAHEGVVYGSDLPLLAWPGRARLLRRPDVSYVTRSRLASGRSPVGPLTIAPEVVVEVIVPLEKATLVERKIAEYLDAGVRLVWVIYPEERRAFVRRPDGSATVIEADDPLSGEDVLPGFSVRLGDLIPTA